MKAKNNKKDYPFYFCERKRNDCLFEVSYEIWENFEPTCGC